MIRHARKAPLRDRLKANPTPLATLATDVKNIPVGLLAPDPDQPRRECDIEGLDRLAASLKEHGQLQPILARKAPSGEGFIIVAGERRWRAAVKAGLASVQAVIVADGDVLVYQLVENCCREDLAPLDRARAFRALLDRVGWTQTRIAQAVGVSQATVSQALSLLEMPTSLRGRVASGEILASVAIELDRHPDKALVARLADDAVRWGWTKSQARTAARAQGAPLAPDEIGAPPRQPACTLPGAKINRIGTPEEIAADDEEGGEVDETTPPNYQPLITEGIRTASPTTVEDDYPAVRVNLLKCNVCGWLKLSTNYSGCPKKHAGGFSFVRTLGPGEGEEAANVAPGAPVGPMEAAAMEMQAAVMETPAGGARGVPDRTTPVPPAPPTPDRAVPSQEPTRPTLAIPRPVRAPEVQGRLNLVYGDHDEETGAEITIVGREPWTPESLLGVLRRLTGKVEREFLKSPKG